MIASFPAAGLFPVSCAAPGWKRCQPSNPVANSRAFRGLPILVIKTWTRPDRFKANITTSARSIPGWVRLPGAARRPSGYPAHRRTETAQWSGERGYTYVAFLTDMDEYRGAVRDVPRGGGGRWSAGHVGRLRLPVVQLCWRHAGRSRRAGRKTSCGEWGPPCGAPESTWRPWVTAPLPARP